MNIDNDNNNLNWSKEEIATPDNSKIMIYLTEFKNASLIFLTDSDNKMGTIAIAVPMKLNSVNRISSSTIPLMFGVKNEFITRAIAEKVANKTNRLSIAITNFTSNIKDHYKILFDVINKILND